MPEINWHSLSLPNIFKKLKSSRRGLDNQEVSRRLKKFGANQLPLAQSLTRLEIVLAQFKSPLVYILLIAAFISFFLGEFVDMWVILAAVGINAIAGFVQENRASQALSKLRQIVKYQANVLRDGTEKRIDSAGLVPGDIIFVGAGDKVPADARLVKSHDLIVVEASLTGESLPVNKKIKKLSASTNLADRENMIYRGTNIAQGRARAIVVATGTKTEIGQVAELVRLIPAEKTPLQAQLIKFSKILGLGVAVLSLTILLVGVFLEQSFSEMFRIAVAIAVSAIPEGMLMSVTVILAIGMQRILKRGSLVRNLVAAETLGSVSIICLDKTGTLTAGKMQVERVLTGREIIQPDALLETRRTAHIEALKISILCNNAVVENPADDLAKWRILGDPTEQALLLAAKQAGLDKAQLEKRQPRLDEIPFNHARKYMATLRRKNERQNSLYLKGAPEKILLLSNFYLAENNKVKKLTSAQKKKISRSVDRLTKKGLRVLAVAYQDLGGSVKTLAPDNLGDFILGGLIGLKDPVRLEASQTIKICRQAGIRPIIVTGDHKLTAQAIASEVGIKTGAENILEGQALDKISNHEFKKLVPRIDVYARVEPKHKLRIIDAWQARGEVVAMTGDGINDSPALKKADIGLALGSGTDVAKETADIVLLDDNFKTIVAAVRFGRVIFENIRKVVLYLLSDSFSEMILIFGSLFLGIPLPILPAQILWINLVADSLPNIALAAEPEEKEIMKERPRSKEEPILNKEMKVLIFIIGIVTDLILFALFYVLLRELGAAEIDRIRAIIFSALAVDSLIYVFSCRSLRHSLWQINPLTNRYLVLAVLGGFALQMVAIYLPFFQNILHTTALGANEWLLVGILAFIKIIAIEVTKWYFIVRKKHVLTAQKF